jgi:hypothetical protein
MLPTCPISVRALQEYLESLADEDDPPLRRRRRLLIAYAEFLFRMRGGGKCAVCRASVRHVLPVSVERLNGTLADFSCLCTRCIEAEKAVSRMVVLQIGRAAVVYLGTTVDQDVPKKKMRARSS